MTELYYYATIIVEVIANTLARIDFYFANKYHQLRNKTLEILSTDVNNIVNEADQAIIFAEAVRDHELKKVRDAHSKALDAFAAGQQSIYTSHDVEKDRVCAARNAKLKTIRHKQDRLYA